MKYYFKYQNQSFSVKDLIRVKQLKIEQLVNNINDELIDLRNAIIKSEIPENKNPNKKLDTVEKIHDFNKQQKAKESVSMFASRPSDLASVARVVRVAKVSDLTRIKILTPKQMLQRLSIALAQVKTGNSYILCIKKNKLLKKIYFFSNLFNNVMNSIS